MARLCRLLAFQLMVLIAAASNGIAEESRLNRESKSIITAVMEKIQLEQDRHFSTCELPAELYPFEYDMWDSLRWLGSRRAINAATSGVSTHLQDLLGANVGLEAEICDGETQEKFTASEFRRLEADPNLSAITIPRLSVSLPLFSHDYQRAVVQFARVWDGRSRMGGRIKGQFEAAVFLVVYRKRGSEWEFWKLKMIGQT